MDWINTLDPTWAYVIVFVVLYISGAGMPIPEEFPLVASGYFVAKGTMSWPGMAFCVAAVLILGDLTAYWLGMRFGEKIWSVPPFRWVLTPKRFEIVRRRFQEHEGKAIFFGRFFAGIRLVTFVFAGIVRVRIWKFVLIDFAAGCLTAPIFIVIAFYVGRASGFEAARKKVAEANLLIVAVVGVGLGITWLVYRAVARRKASLALNSEAAPGGVTVVVSSPPPASVREPG